MVGGKLVRLVFLPADDWDICIIGREDVERKPRKTMELEQSIKFHF